MSEVPLYGSTSFQKGSRHGSKHGIGPQWGSSSSFSFLTLKPRVV